MSKRQKVEHFTHTPAILHGRASRFVPGYGRNIRGRASQTDAPTSNLPEAPPAEALATCERALTAVDEELEALKRRHRECWVHITSSCGRLPFGRKKCTSARKILRKPFTRSQIPSRQLSPPNGVRNQHRVEQHRVEASAEPPSSPGSDVCLNETQLDAWANAVLTEFEGTSTETL